MKTVTVSVDLDADYDHQSQEMAESVCHALVIMATALTEFYPANVLVRSDISESE